ncbi:conjugal transfer protein TraG N-terminal domain-containing protein (plasmid) [Escherichia coli]|uniref:conjugal transfer protein TraG N-terminal domain-containing protein n=1 Tax=Escherichia coli TaxID=562 RepID=UPI003AB2D0E6
MAQTILVGITIGIFPLLVLAAVFNKLTLSVLRGYVFALMWLQSWPMLYAILNSAMTFYAKQNGAPVVLSEISQIQLKYSDLASTAGYLSMMIPAIILDDGQRPWRRFFQRVQPFRFLCYQPDCQCGRQCG